MSLVDPSFELIDPCPDIFALFKQFDDQFFSGQLAMCEVKWSPRMTTCAGICVYEGRGGLCSIRLSKPLLTLRPRKDLVETLLHEMIHAFLFVTRRFNIRDGADGHGPMFQEHMHRINGKAGTRITIYHSFHAEVANFKQHWWRCRGSCRERRPFFGWVKRASNRAPGPNDLWWKQHMQSCGGHFEKVKEPEGYGQKKKSSQKAVEGAPKNRKIDEYFNVSGKKVKPFAGKGKALGDAPTTSKNPPIKKNGNAAGASGSSSNDNIHKLPTGQTAVRGRGSKTIVINGKPPQNEKTVETPSSAPAFTGSGQTLGGGTTGGRSRLLDLFESKEKPASQPKCVTIEEDEEKPGPSNRKRPPALEDRQPDSKRPTLTGRAQELVLVAQKQPSEKREMTPPERTIDELVEDIQADDPDPLLECPACQEYFPRSLINEHLDPPGPLGLISLLAFDQFSDSTRILFDKMSGSVRKSKSPSPDRAKIKKSPKVSRHKSRHSVPTTPKVLASAGNFYQSSKETLGKLFHVDGERKTSKERKTKAPARRPSRENEAASTSREPVTSREQMVSLSGRVLRIMGKSAKSGGSGKTQRKRSAVEKDREPSGREQRKKMPKLDLLLMGPTMHAARETEPGHPNACTQPSAEMATGKESRAEPAVVECSGVRQVESKEKEREKEKKPVDEKEKSGRSGKKKKTAEKNLDNTQGSDDDDDWNMRTSIPEVMVEDPTRFEVVAVSMHPAIEKGHHHEFVLPEEGGKEKSKDGDHPAKPQPA
ncbi:unnamed protein product, partial [Mesorhabditis spiculigera]